MDLKNNSETLWDRSLTYTFSDQWGRGLTYTTNYATREITFYELSH